MKGRIRYVVYKVNIV